MIRQSKVVTIVVVCSLAFVASGCVTAYPPPTVPDRGDSSDATLQLSSRGTSFSVAEASDYLALATASEETAQNVPAGEDGVRPLEIVGLALLVLIVATATAIAVS